MDNKFLRPTSYSAGNGGDASRSLSYNNNGGGDPMGSRLSFNSSPSPNTANISRMPSAFASHTPSGFARRQSSSSVLLDRRQSSITNNNNSNHGSHSTMVEKKKTKGEWQAEIKKRMWLFDSHNSRLQRRVALGADEMEKEKARTKDFVKSRSAPSSPKKPKASRRSIKKAKTASEDDDDKPFASNSSSNHSSDDGGSTNSEDEREKDEDEELDEMDDDEELFALMHGGKGGGGGDESPDFSAVSQWGSGGGGAAGGGSRTAGHKDVGLQSMYGSKADACVATVITTADLAKLIPMPDDAVMLRASLGSLQKLERHAAELLSHVQREISLQVENAGVSYTRQENKHHRMGQLGSATVHEFRNNAMARSLQEAASREADYLSHSVGISAGLGGGAEAGQEANLTKFRYEDGGKLTIRPGTTYSDRREIQYGGSSATGGHGNDGASTAATRNPYYPPTAHHRPQTGMCHLGLSRTPFSGSTGYSLYDAKTKSKLNMLMSIGADMTSRHGLYDNINHSVEYFSPLRDSIGEMARRDAEAAQRAAVEAQEEGSCVGGGGSAHALQHQRYGSSSGGGAALPPHQRGRRSSQQQQPSYDQILGKPNR